jgi:hypothetical protein
MGSAPEPGEGSSSIVLTTRLVRGLIFATEYPLETHTAPSHVATSPSRPAPRTRATTRPLDKESRNKQPEKHCSFTTDIQAAPSPTANPGLFSNGSGRVRTARVWGSMRTMPARSSVQRAPSPKERIDETIGIVPVTLPVAGSTRRIPELSVTHKLPAP